MLNAITDYWVEVRKRHDSNKKRCIFDHTDYLGKEDSWGSTMEGFINKH